MERNMKTENLRNALDELEVWVNWALANKQISKKDAKVQRVLLRAAWFEVEQIQTAESK
jgi:hypothetical protein